MSSQTTIYILGSGAIGFSLAAYLAAAGRPVVAVRSSRDDIAPTRVTVSVQNGFERVSVALDTASLAQLAQLDGLIVITSKAYANDTLARVLQAKAAKGPIVIMQNGVGVEQPFIDAGFPTLYRCVLYVTSQASGESSFTFRPITSSPIGLVQGDEAGLQQCVAALDTAAFPFCTETNIQREIWKKAIINAAFNSICPLLDIDNGVFARDLYAEQLARDLIGECVQLTKRLAIDLSEDELIAQLMHISRGSDGQLISTLQDIKQGRPTEIAFLNLAIAHIAAALHPSLELPRVALLGKMIVAKSALQGSTKE